jgi:cyclophilin family peptidyl-prolyl cis-trans isomerase
VLRFNTTTAADELLSSDSNALRHDAAGVVSIANGGGTFEFTITPGPNGQLDATHTVIGQVCE